MRHYAYALFGLALIVLTDLVFLALLPGSSELLPFFAIVAAWGGFALAILGGLVTFTVLRSVIRRVNR